MDEGGAIGDPRRFLIGVGLYAATAIIVAVALFGGRHRGPADHEATTTTAGPAPTTTVALRTPTAEAPLRILVAGDSLVGWIAPALETELANAPVEIIDDWKGSSGLVRPDFFDWPARLARDVDEHDPDVVIVGFGGNDAQNLTAGDRVLLVGTPEWQHEYERRAAEVLDTVAAPGRTLYWIGMPLTEAEAIEHARPAITAAVRAELGERGGRPWAHWVDTMPVLAPDGEYRVYLDDPDGQEVRVRADDGVHPSPQGGRFIVRSFLEDLRRERHLAS